MLFGGLVEDSEDPHGALNEDGAILYANPALVTFLGLPSAECRGISLYDSIAFEDQPRARLQIAQWRAGGSSGTLHFEARQRTLAGDELPIEWSLHERSAAGTGSGLIFVKLRDITDRRLLEQKIKEEEIWYRTMLASVLEPVVTMDSRGVIQSASDSVETTFGWKPQELIGVNVSVLMAESNRDEYDKYLALHLAAAKEKPSREVREFSAIRRDGTPIRSELAITRFDLPGRPEPFFTGSFRDVTARKLAEEELQASEELLRAVFDNDYQFRCIVDPDGSLMRVNQACLAALQTSVEQASGQSLWELSWWRDSAARRARIRDAVALAAHGSTQQFEFDLHSLKDGWIKVDLVLIPISDPGGKVRFLFFEARNVTDEREAQEAERRMLETFAEIGASAAEVIHEIKNPISGIHVALRAVARELKQDERKVLEDLASRLSRLEHRLRRTLQFAKPVTARRLPLSASAVLERAIQEVRPAADGWGITIEHDAPQTATRFLGDPDLMHEALINLLLNALECGTKRVRASVRADRDRISFIVEDAGPGVPPENYEAIFKPFITTKASGNGIGLSLVRKAALTHGGTVSVERGDLGGARFTILVPSPAALGFDDAN